MVLGTSKQFIFTILMFCWQLESYVISLPDHDITFLCMTLCTFINAECEFLDNIWNFVNKKNAWDIWTKLSVMYQKCLCYISENYFSTGTAAPQGNIMCLFWKFSWKSKHGTLVFSTSWSRLRVTTWVRSHSAMLMSGHVHKTLT